MPHPEFFSGFLGAGLLVCALFFLRFWLRTKDGLFAAFAFAFLLMSAQQMLIVFLDPREEDRSWIYVLRLIAFLSIIFAIVRKNMKR